MQIYKNGLVAVGPGLVSVMEDRNETDDDRWKFSHVPVEVIRGTLKIPRCGACPCCGRFWSP